MRSAARLAAWIPATRATASTSPLLTALDATLAEVSGCMYTRQRATARRWVGSFGVTSTIRARPRGSRCVRPRSDMAASLPGSLSAGRGAPLPGPRCTETRSCGGFLYIWRCWSGSAADLGHAAVGPDERDLADAVAGPLAAYLGLDGGGQLVIGRAAAQQRAQIGLAHGEQA